MPCIWATQYYGWCTLFTVVLMLDFMMWPVLLYIHTPGVAIHTKRHRLQALTFEVLIDI